MVCSWLPDPSAGHRSPTDISGLPLFIVDSDNEEQDAVHTDPNNIFENDGYQLLSENDPGRDWRPAIHEHDDDESADTDQISVSNIENSFPEGNENSSSDETKGSSESTEDPQRDIVVDLDQVQAAMAHITLPASAIPPWAAEVPDSELRSFLQSRITILEQKNAENN